MSSKEWGSLPLLDALRPEPGWSTDFAVLATYSADLVAVVAALLALAGLDDEHGSGSKVDFANAIEALRDRARVLVQAGRIAAPTKAPKILAILDRFISEVAMDEAEGSWHPKVGLVRMTAGEEDVAQWRLWLGSRNLTRDCSWDAGLALVGHSGSGGRRIPGVPELGRELAARADLKGAKQSAVFRELQSIRWEMPAGCTVEEVRLLLGSGRAMPEPPPGIRKLAVVSPFLDGTTVRHFGRWGDQQTQRVLVSSIAELGKLAGQVGCPLSSYQDVLFLEAPSPEVDGLAPAEDQPSPESEDHQPESRGLHAKLIYAEHKGGRSLWLGSANATGRGWRGPNTEIIARLSVDAEIGAGLQAFIDEIGRTADLGALPPPEREELEERLEEARRQVAARWNAVQRIQKERLVIEARQLPHPDDPKIQLWVGLLGQPSATWPRGPRSLELPSVTHAETTELVHCEVRLQGESLAWLQRAPLDPPPDDQRDHQALARYLDPRTFLLWVRSLLTSHALSDGGGRLGCHYVRTPCGNAFVEAGLVGADPGGGSEGMVARPGDCDASGSQGTTVPRRHGAGTDRRASRRRPSDPRGVSTHLGGAQKPAGGTNVVTSAKPFQEATVDAALRAFRTGRRYRRFLIADEVGLGKTVVAQRVIRRMMRGRKEPLVVFYLCSNLSIAAQNRRKLLEILPTDERGAAASHVDRLTLLPASHEQPTHPRLRLFCLTPDTSVPMRRGQRRDGRQEERALIHALVERTLPWLFQTYKRSVFRRHARAYWSSYYIPRARELARSKALRRAFRASVREEFGVTEGEHLDVAVERRELDELSLIAHLRNALAASAIEELQPDLVIFDEFQRFRDLLSPGHDSAAQRVIGRLRGDGVEEPPALLLLSATPYRLYSRRAEEAAGSHRSEFFELIEFLYGGTPQAKERRRDCEGAFAVMEAELRKGEPTSRRATEARARAEELLREVMARTERASHPAGWEDHVTTPLAASLVPDDIAIFKHTSQSFSDSHQRSAVPYWTSIPLPMQTMGSHYVAWKAARDAPVGDSPRLDETMRDDYRRPTPWPHPRLRAMKELLAPEQAVVPWIAPSNPWWKLRGPWKKEATGPSKALLFSRFRAAPQAVASALSFELEAHYLRRERVAYPEVMKRRLLPATEGRHALLALFHPSPFLVGATDPLVASDRELTDVRKALREQVKRALREVEVEVDSRAPNLPTWKLLARLEARAGYWRYVHRAWKRLNARLSRGESADGGLAHLLSDWGEEACAPLEGIRPSGVDSLASYALTAPGIVVGRALQRHWPEAVEEDGYAHTLEAAWSGLRNYLDQRWFFSALRRKGEKYPDVIRRAIVDGNLESVLDEHLWITSQLRSLGGSQLADELRDGLSIKTGLFFLHPLGDKKGETFSLRCHVAMPFVEGRAAYAHEAGSREREEGPRIRTDELRKAFNTPFWPYVLATTSVGQEGLDFHAWCDTIVHWDLCRNPVDLEQREGRIQRFGGLSIRRAVIEQLGGDSWSRRVMGESPWAAIQRLAEERLADESGLAPWCVCRGGGVRRFVLDVPTSEQRHWLEWIRQQRLLYRLALGQPNQEDLVELLARREHLSFETVRDAAINLSPWFGAGR